MRSYRSNLFTNCDFTGGTEIGKGGPLLAATISPGGPGGTKIFVTGHVQITLKPYCCYSHGNL